MKAVAKQLPVKIAIALIIALCRLTGLYAQVSGCTDPAASNYNGTATLNDGLCIYNNTSVTPRLNANMNTTLIETSGLIYWNKAVWTHNDSGGQPALYSIDSTTGNITKTVSVTNATNVDWEDITQDDKFIYIGDFGNNANGNRQDLRIYKVKKADVKIKTSVTATVINFSYSDQADFTPKGSRNTNFDCEALIAYGDSLFLFSKDWLDHKTRLYKLPKNPGTYTAIKTAELDVQGLITGAEIVPGKKVIVLTGYDAAIKPFVYLLYDFTDTRFFDANKRKVAINQTLTQMEGICAINARKFFVSNERLQAGITVPAQLQTINLGPLLNPYYTKLAVNGSAQQAITLTNNLSGNNSFSSK
jgi:hypothetical protein